MMRWIGTCTNPYFTDIKEYAYGKEKMVQSLYLYHVDCNGRFYSTDGHSTVFIRIMVRPAVHTQNGA